MKSFAYCSVWWLLILGLVFLDHSADLAQTPAAADADRIDKLFQEGRALAAKGAWPDALTQFEAARAAAEAAGHKKWMLHIMVWIGYARGQQGNYPKALEMLQRTAAMAEELNEKADWAQALNQLGDLHERRGQFPEARMYFEKAIQVATTAQLKGGLQHAWNGLGNVCDHLGDYAEAKAYYQKALTVAEELGEKRRMAAGLTNLGIVCFNQGLYREALSYHQKSLKIREDLGNKRDMAVALNAIGSVYMAQGLPAQALECFHRAIKLAEELGEPDALPLALGNVGVVYSNQGLYGQAIAFYQKALQKAEALGYKKTAADTLGNIGVVYQRQRQLDSALEYMQKALKAREALGDKRGTADTLQNIGLVYRMQGLFDQSLNYYQRALKIREALGDKSVIAMSFYNLAGFYEQQGAYDQAVEYFQTAWKLSEEVQAKNVMGLALKGLGHLYVKLLQYSQAIKSAQQALAIGEEIKDTHIIWHAHYVLASAYERSGDRTRALGHGQKAIAEIEKVRAQAGSDEGKTSYFQDKVAAYKNLLGLLNILHAQDSIKGYDVEMFHYAERARARAFLDLMAEAKINRDQDLDPELRLRRRELEARMAYIQSQLRKQHSEKSPDRVKIQSLTESLAEAEEAYRLLRMEIRRRHPGYADLQYPEPVRLEQAQQRLDEKTALLEYVLGEDQSFLLAVSRRDYRVVRLPGAAALSGRVRKLREWITHPPSRTTFSNYVQEAQALYRELIQPAGALLIGKQALIIVPDGILHYLPFEVLVKPNLTGDAAVVMRSLPYLVRNYAISYVSSASVLVELGRNPETLEKPQKTLLAYADPVYDQEEPGPVSANSGAARRAFGEESPWPPKRLPYTRTEVERIARLYPAQEVAVFLGEQASEESLKVPDFLRQYRIIHFAVHGLLNERKPQFSGLVLSPPGVKAMQGSLAIPAAAQGADDGLLQVHEIMNLKLQADLVVLSACETGLGKEVQGEGLIGLTRAFLSAGARSVMVSLWQVEDRSTAELMPRFYRYLKNPKLNKAQALRRAQLDLLAERTMAHPYHWAPFVLVGRP